MANPVTKIGKYEIIEQVGEGAMGVVYRAADPVLNRPVAVKVMNEGLAQDAALRERFLREAQAAGSLQHPNVVTIYDFGETDGHLFIAMEFIEGSDLEELLNRGKNIPLAAKLDIVIDVLNGLAYAHRRGIVHRDIKPANIRIDGEGHARIMDFGVAHLATSNLTGTGVMMGTPNYMAPEQITTGEVTARTDIFSVGAVLFELLTNIKPFAADTLHRVLFRIVSDAPPEILDVVPDLPLALDKVIKKALAKDVSHRYASATEMANDLSAVRSSIGAPRASRTVSQRSSIEKALLAQRQSQQSRDVRRWQIISAAAALLFVVGGGGGVYFAMQRAGSPAAAPPEVRTDSPTAPDRTGTPAQPPASVVVAGTTRDSSAAAAARTPETQAQAPMIPPPPRPRTSDSAATGRAAPQRTGNPVRPPTTTPRTRVDTAPPRTTVAQRDTARADPAPAPPVQPVVTDSSRVGQVSTPLSSARTDSVPPRIVTPAENPRTAATAIVNAYARAIAARDVDQLKRVYPGMTASQQSAWESFFSSVRSMTASLQIESFSTGADSTVAHIVGAYEFVTRAGRSERQPASFRATFHRDGERWRLQTVR